MKPRLVNDKFLINTIDCIADWDAPSEWERKRLLHMEDHLHPGETLFCVGVEHGWWEAVVAQFVGGENMVLFEPSPHFWVDIRLHWEANGYLPPKGCFAGLVADTTVTPEKVDFDGTIIAGFPACAWATDEEQEARSYRYIGHGTTPQITIDDYCKQTGIECEALSVDVEGWELSVLRGAKDALTTRGVKVWVSVHPDLICKNYGMASDEEATNAVINLMHSYGYKEEFIAVDHETHYYFEKR